MQTPSWAPNLLSCHQSKARTENGLSIALAHSRQSSCCSSRESCLGPLSSNLVTRKLSRLSKKGRPRDPLATPSFLCSPLESRDQSSGWYWACSAQRLRRVASPQLPASERQKTLDSSLGRFSCGPAGQSKSTGLSTAPQSPWGLSWLRLRFFKSPVQGSPTTQAPK